MLSKTTRMRRPGEQTREYFHLVLPQPIISLLSAAASARGNRIDEFGEVPKDCIDSITMSPRVSLHQW